MRAKLTFNESCSPTFLSNRATGAGDVQTLVGLQTMDHRYDPDPGKGSVHDITFKNIFLEGNCTDNFMLGYSDQSRVYNIHLQNISIGGQRIKTLRQFPLRTNAYTGLVDIR